MTTVTVPGIYDIDEAEYHADPVPESSLSVSGAKVILDCPARYQWTRQNRRVTKAFDFGHAAHAKILGVGMRVAVIPDDVLSSNGGTNTKAARAFIDEAREAGAVPLKATEAAKVDAMAEQLAQHPIAAKLFADGTPEVSAFWRDPDTNVMLRGRCDWVTKWADGRPVIVDFKTTTNASPAEFRWEAGRFGYHMQDVWYRELLDGITGEQHLFLFVAQEKEPPYYVTVHELDDDARDVGAQRNRVARRLYLDCVTRDHWPAYPPVVHSLSIPNARYAPEAPSE